tara:strand:- start:480 stop:632 length:153 start_codon:yes stop_codon:yes gene_type:complete
MKKFMKAITALVSSGGAAGVMEALGMPLEVTTPVVAVVAALMVWLVPNKA